MPTGRATPASQCRLTRRHADRRAERLGRVCNPLVVRRDYNLGRLALAATFVDVLDERLAMNIGQRLGGQARRRVARRDNDDKVRHVIPLTVCRRDSICSTSGIFLGHEYVEIVSELEITARQRRVIDKSVLDDLQAVTAQQVEEPVGVADAGDGMDGRSGEPFYGPHERAVQATRFVSSQLEWHGVLFCRRQ